MAAHVGTTRTSARAGWHQVEVRIEVGYAVKFDKAESVCAKTAIPTLPWAESHGEAG